MLTAALLTKLAFTASAALVPVSYPSGAEMVRGEVALPTGAGRHPALIVIHEWWGLNEFVRGKARDFAGEGYLSLAVDLYRGKVAEDADTAHQLSRGLPEDRAKRDLAAAFAYLAARPDVDRTRIGVIGWCLGGGFAMDEALQEPRLRAAVIYYGRLPTDRAAIAQIKAPLLGNYGWEDQGISPEMVEAFSTTANAAGVKLDFVDYHGAGHGFASSKDPKVFKPDLAKKADARTAAFLAEKLKGS